MIGETVGNYEILETLGEGGFGVVYKARDRRLKRLVALKFLSSGRSDAISRSRFLKEAQTASSLNHPNIVIVHDIGEHYSDAYIVMEFVDGTPLNKLLSAEGLAPIRALDYLTQLCEALAVAHTAGIIHRDLKPNNAIVDRHDRVKVLDFGLAKVTTGSGLESTGEGPLTAVGTFVGTVAYMSPEQSQAAHVDCRSDIFSLGILAQELFTGRRPFSGTTQWALLHAICSEPPRLLRETHPHLPRSLESIILRMLAKRPDDRFQSVREVLDVLVSVRRELGVAVTSEKAATTPVVSEEATRSVQLPGSSTSASSSAHERIPVGVLMFRNLSPTKDDEYIAEGMASEIVRALSGVPGVRVISQLASSRYRGDPAELDSVVKAMHLRYVVTGSIRHAGSRIRAIAELDDVVEGSQIWSHTYDRGTEDIFAVQEEVAEAIVAAVSGQLLRARSEAAARVPTEHLDAAGLVRRAYYFTTKAYHAGGIQEAIELLRRATRLDPNHAVAHAFLGFYLIQCAVNGSSCSVEQDRAEALAAAERAILLGPSEPEVLENAGLVLVHCGKFTKAVQTLRRAVELAPLNQVAWGYLALELGWAGSAADIVEAHSILNRLLTTAADHPSTGYWHCFQAGIYTREGKWEEAAASACRGITIQPRFAPGLAAYANALCCLGRGDEAREIAMQMVAVNPTGTQAAYMTELLLTTGSPERAEPHIRGLVAAGIFRGDLPWVLPTPPQAASK
jgi:serine/threonine protein kinase/tetratricopeptide (TPR) repeat protein